MRGTVCSLNATTPGGACGFCDVFTDSVSFRRVCLSGSALRMRDGLVGWRDWPQPALQLHQTATLRLNRQRVVQARGRVVATRLRQAAGVQVLLLQCLESCSPRTLWRRLKRHADQHMHGTRPLPPSHSPTQSCCSQPPIPRRLERHADHHMHGSRPFHLLRNLPDAPQLPISCEYLLVWAVVCWAAERCSAAAAVLTCAEECHL